MTVLEFMRELVEHQRETREYDRWFRAKVQEALDDPRPGLRHEVVMDETRTMIDRIAAEKAKK